VTDGDGGNGAAAPEPVSVGVGAGEAGATSPPSADDGTHWQAESRPKPRRTVVDPTDHSADRHRWVVRTPDGDQMAASTRLATSWPLLRMYAVRQFRLRYRQSALGLGWTVVQPLALVAIYGFIFYNVLGIQTDEKDGPFLSVVWIGITVMMYLQAAIQSGTVSLVNDAWLLARVWFPREIIPLAPVIAGLLDLAVTGGILVVIVAVQGATPSWPLLALPLVVALLVVWVAALPLIPAALPVFFRDMATIVSLCLRLLFIATPVFYSQRVVPEEYGWIQAVNPFAVVVNNIRHIILGQVWPNWELVALHGVVGVGLFAGGLWYIRAVERRMVDVV